MVARFLRQMSRLSNRNRQEPFVFRDSSADVGESSILENGNIGAPAGPSGIPESGRSCARKKPETLSAFGRETRRQPKAPQSQHKPLHPLAQAESRSSSGPR